MPPMRSDEHKAVRLPNEDLSRHFLLAVRHASMTSASSASIPTSQMSPEMTTVPTPSAAKHRNALRRGSTVDLSTLTCVSDRIPTFASGRSAPTRRDAATAEANDPRKYRREKFMGCLSCRRRSSAGTGSCSNTWPPQTACTCRRTSPSQAVPSCTYEPKRR